VALILVNTILDPTQNAKHYVLACITTFVAGMIVHAAANRRRMEDALAERNYFRDEVNRMAAAKEKVERRLLSDRSSSLKQVAASSEHATRRKG
jgi:hypothetical protein